MIQKLNNWLKNREENRKKQNELKNAKKFYTFVKAGATFVKFIQEDLKRNESEMNRHQRRRFEKEISENGMFSEEMVKYYSGKVDWILSEIEKKLNPPNQPKSNVQIHKEKPIDAK